MYDTTIEVDRDYLWALEVLACDSLGIDGETSQEYPTRYGDAIGVASAANLNQPSTRELEEETDYEYRSREEMGLK